MVDEDAVPDDRPLDWLLRDHVESVPSAAYKYRRRPPGHFDGTHRDGQYGPPRGQRAVTGRAAPCRPADRTRLLHIFGRVEESIGN